MAYYLNFPIVLLEKIFTDKDDCLDFIIGFAVYQRAHQLFGEVNTGFMKLTADDMGIKLGKPQRDIKEAVSYLKVAPNPNNLGPYVGVNKDIIFDYYKNDKTEFQIVSFCAFCAVRSILGKKLYCKTNKGLIHARMFGYTSTKNYPRVMTNLQKKYLNRYHIDKVLQELELNWHLKLFGGNCRGFYVSFDLDHNSLALIHNKAKKKVKIDELKRKKSEARKFVLDEKNYTAATSTTPHQFQTINNTALQQ